MGELIGGIWQRNAVAAVLSDGALKGPPSISRNWIGPRQDGRDQAGRTFDAEAGRYHLYVSLACPWAHRTIIMRSLKGLEDTISVSVVHWLMLENGWALAHG